MLEFLGFPRDVSAQMHGLLTPRSQLTMQFAGAYHPYDTAH